MTWKYQPVVDVALDVWRLYGAVGYSTETQDITDSEMYEFVEEILELEEDEKADMTTQFGEYDVTLTASLTGQPTVLKLPVPGLPPNIRVVAKIDDVIYGQINYNVSGVTDLGFRDLYDGIGDTKVNLAGTGFDKQEKSYLAYQLRELVVQAVNTKVGARDQKPGLTMEITDIAYFANRGKKLFNWALERRKDKSDVEWGNTRDGEQVIDV